ncbi:MAG: sodium:solute symporter, partial [Marivivens sp.]|nr:sodium:solute symporter [Marivivens sp.]
GSNPDLFVLTIPLSQGLDGLAIFSFLGGFSSATSMVIVATIALATMISNHIVTPLWLSSKGPGAVVSGDIRQLVIGARRLSIAGVLLLGYIYFRLSGGGEALAAIGLISFAGVVQVLPAMIGGIFWRGATRWGAVAGITVGFVIWAWSLFLPSFGPDGILPQTVIDHGPFGIAALRPQALFGITEIDPLIHALMWSMLLNSVAFFFGSVLTFPQPLERLQGAQFVNIFEHSEGARAWTTSTAEAEDLLIMAQRILGSNEAQVLFQQEAQRQGKAGYLPEVTPEFVQNLERELAGSVGAATAHAMVGQFIQGASVSVEDLIAVADEAAQIMEYSNRLEQKSAEQERTARQLRDANEKLTQLSIQKDAFLSQISHELRTPMTSIRSFSEILREGGMSDEELSKYSGIIHDEAMRLTRLLDDLLDLSVLENGQVTLNMGQGNLKTVIDRAVSATAHSPTAITVKRRDGEETIPLYTDLDRLTQVFINLIANAGKYCDAKRPVLRIEPRKVAGEWVVDFIDNGA